MAKSLAGPAGALVVLVVWLLATAPLSADPVDPAAGATGAGPVPVQVVRDGNRWQLLRDGKPYVVRGAGIEYGDLEAFARHGGNSFRTWAVDTEHASGEELLDKAHALGLTVSLGLPVAAERWGFDYDDPAAVAAQQEVVRGHVMRLRHHPALLTWIIGNELNFDYTNPKVYDAVNGIAEMIHEIDPNHPVTTTTAGFRPELADVIAERAPALDFLSIQMYGELVLLPKYLRKYGMERPYMVTEWGAIGHWEMPKTRWGAPVEQDSSSKAGNYLKSWRSVVNRNDGNIIGNYVFLWGHKQERTPTWYGMFTEQGEATEAVEVMHEIWTGSPPANRAPRVKTMRLNRGGSMDSLILDAGKSYPAVFRVKDPDGDTLTYRWGVKPESGATQVGGDFEAAIPDLPGLVQGSGAKVTITAPERQGAYRLFAYAADGNGHAAHANIPFFVRER